MYELYVRGRDKLGLQFKRHRTQTAFAEATRSPWLAWKHACADNADNGNPLLPAWLKAALEVFGVILIAIYGAKSWRFLSVFALLALAQTASEQESSGGYGYGGQDENEESERLGRSFDRIEIHTPYHEGEVWPDCSCSECRGGCNLLAALPSGGLCTNCAVGFHR